MDHGVSKFTVYFETPFWVGVYERSCGGRYEVSKIIFGAEPKDYEIYDALLTRFHKLHFSPALPGADRAERRVSPKRMQRDISRQLEQTGAGTKAQQALKLQQEAGKLARKTNARARREEEQARQFQLRQEKRKEKHRGH